MVRISQSVVCVLFLWLAVGVSAETIPATGFSGMTANPAYTSCVETTSYNEACIAWGVELSKRVNPACKAEAIGTTSQCQVSGANNCSGTTWLRSCTSYKCDTSKGWTLSGANCVRPDCTPPQVRNETTGGCEIPCTFANNAVFPGFYSVSWPAVPGTQYCINNCRSYGPFGNVVTGGGVRTGQFASYGEPCTGSSVSAPGALQPDTPASKCIANGQAYGTVNGVVVCTPPSGISTVDTKSVTTPDPSGNSTTNKTTSTVCSGDGSCTTTTTTTITSGGSGPGGTGPESTTSAPTTTTTDQSKAGFCEENPNSPMCKPSDPCLENPDRLECMNAGTPPEEGPLDTVDKSVVSNITPVNIASNASCPADVPLGKGVYMTYSGICQYAEGLRPIVLASAWLLAGIIALSMAKA